MLKLILRAAVLSAALTAGSAAQAADKLTVLLEWFVNPDHAPLVVAEQLGMFAEAGLEVTLIPPADPSVVPRLVAAGQAEIGIHYQPNLYLDFEAGVPVTRFATLVETPLNSVIVKADGPIKGLEDLKGRSVGYSVSGMESAILGQMLATAGLKLEDVDLVNVNFALSPALLSDRVDATIGGFRNFEMTQLRLEGQEVTAFYPEEHGVPAYDELIFITRPELVEDIRLSRFMDVVEQATLYLTNHPEESWKLFIAAHPDLDNALNRQAWIDTLPRFAKRPRALDTHRYQRFGSFLAASGLISKAPPVSTIAVEIQ
ncbi:ABC transporter ATP-binding protein [Aureimonas fodinaquatilis]|uniref:ABC transporter ATP-binding protein n=1 Tax=Aureimonas fodinaquatilis TaxID=2565783 RepID=A0A5B0DZ64_9HYPH|nr:ABC transporter substrate-binding protein [Aureimonas fodinaquatilis]KAA0971726.1 ABC transporter ATP-binding protein [Aureimonas fodinaquatilis]